MLRYYTTGLGVLFIISLTNELGNCHPQCLDFRAPFKPNKELNFCSEYSELGCCSTSDDAILSEEYENIKARVKADEWDSCYSYVKQLICQNCSPYAAHIFDAEDTKKPRRFPGLCTEYCEMFYGNCSSIVRFLDPDLAARNIVRSRRRFCKRVALKDEDYCYPKLITNPLLQRHLTRKTNQETTAGCLCLKQVKGELANPLWARHAGDGSHRLFVALQKGEVYIYNTKNQIWLNRPFLDLTDKVLLSNYPADERGFLGMAFHPSFRSTRRFFVYYVMPREADNKLPLELEGREQVFTSNVRISEFLVSKTDPDMADPSSEKVILDIPQPYANHNGGELYFGTDGYLYAFVGDGGAAGDPMEAGQNKSLLHGKVLRLDVDSNPDLPYVIPSDNPFVHEPKSKPEIFAYGVRNIWRCGLDTGDRQTGSHRGRVLCADVGQNAHEEVNLLKKGANYGWRAREGFECYDNELCGNIGPEELPVFSYNHTVGKSVTGGVFYRGCENPSLSGKYIYADYISSRFFSLTDSGGEWANQDVTLCGPELCQGNLVGEMSDYILSFGEDEQGEIYVLTSKSSRSNRNDGKIFKIIDPITRGDPTACELDPSQRSRVLLYKTTGAGLPQNGADSLPSVHIVSTHIRIRVNRKKKSQQRSWASRKSRKRSRKRNRTSVSRMAKSQKRREKRLRRKEEKRNRRRRNRRRKHRTGLSDNKPPIESVNVN